MMIARKRFQSIMIMMLILILQVIVFWGIGEKVDTYSAIRIASWLCLISFVLGVCTWKQATSEVFCPYVFFFSCLFLFCCGQCITWAFDFELGDRNLLNRVDYGLTDIYVLKSLVFSSLALTTFHIGALSFIKDKRNYITRWSSQDVMRCFDSIGKILIILIIPAYLANTIQLVFAVKQGGYLASYDVIYARSSLLKILGYIADYIQPCLLILLVANAKKSKAKRNFIFILFAIDIISKLYLGGRNKAVLSIVGIVLCIHYFVRPFKKRDIVWLVVFGYIGIAILNAIAITRIDSDRGVFDVFAAIDLSPYAVIGGIIEELGWNLSSTTWTMMHIPSDTSYYKGMSYFTAPLGAIPNLGFWAVHPAKLYDPSEWLQRITNASYGLGYTMFAESYINFGWFGICFLFFIGGIITRIFDKVRFCEVEDDLLGATFEIMIIMTLTKLLVRSTFGSTIREIVYVLIPLHILISSRLRRLGKGKL